MSDDASLDEFVESDSKNLSEGKWRTHSLGDLAEYQNGNSFSKDEWVDEGYPIIRIQNLTEEQTEFNYYDGDLEERYKVQSGDILLSWSATIDVFQWRGSDAALNQHIFRVDISDSINDTFYLFKLESLLPQLEALSHGSTMKHVRKADLVNLDTQIPPLSEQRKIATTLYTVDQAIRKNDEIIEQIKRIEQGLMQDIFRQGIGSSDTKELRRIGEIPQHWEIVSLGDVCTEITDGTHKSPPTIENGYPYVTSQNVRDWGFDLTDLKHIAEEDHKRITSRCNPEPNDVLYVKDGANTGNVNVNTLDFEFSLLSSVALIKPDRSRLKPWFLKYLLSWSKFRELVLSQMSGTGISRLTISKLEKTDILLPPIKEQERIVEILDTYYEHHKNQRQYGKQLKCLKQGLMRELLSGEVRTTDVNIDIPEEVAKYG